MAALAVCVNPGSCSYCLSDHYVLFVAFGVYVLDGCLFLLVLLEIGSKYARRGQDWTIYYNE